MCTIAWTEGAAVVESAQLGADDAEVLGACADAERVGIGCPCVATTRFSVGSSKTCPATHARCVRVFSFRYGAQSSGCSVQCGAIPGSRLRLAATQS